MDKITSDVVKNDAGENVLYVHFERPTEEGFDSVRFELPTYRIVYKGRLRAKEPKRMVLVISGRKESRADIADIGIMELKQYGCEGTQSL